MDQMFLLFCFLFFSATHTRSKALLSLYGGGIILMLIRSKCPAAQPPTAACKKYSEDCPFYLAAVAIARALAAATSSARFALFSVANCASNALFCFRSSASFLSRAVIFCRSCCLVVTKLCSLKIKRNSVNLRNYIDVYVYKPI